MYIHASCTRSPSMQVYRVLLGFSKSYLATRRLRTWACSLRMTICDAFCIWSHEMWLTVLVHFLNCTWCMSYRFWSTLSHLFHKMLLYSCFSPFIRLFVDFISACAHQVHVCAARSPFMCSQNHLYQSKDYYSESLVKVCHHWLSFPSHKTINNIQSDILLLISIYNIVQKF